MLRRIFTRIRINASNLVLLIRFWRREKGSPADKTVYFEISEPKLERYFYWLLKMFDIAGWKVCLKANLNLLLNLRNGSEFIYDISRLEIRTKAPTECDLVISGRPKKGAIVLDTDYFRSDKPKNSFSLPFSFSPNILHYKLYEKAPELRSNQRNIRCLVRGSYLDYYDNPELDDLFGVVNRFEATIRISELFSDSEDFFEVETKGDVENVLSGTAVDLVLLRNSTVGVEKWLEFLAHCDFFVGLPGFMMPFSHNLYESMAVGCIPILQYGHLLEPPLIDGETCIAFEDIESLVKKINYSFSIDDQTINRMRKNVIEYYQTHLEPISVVRNIEERMGSLERIYIIAGHLSVQELKDRRKQEV